MEPEERDYWYATVEAARTGDQYHDQLLTQRGAMKLIDPYAREVTNSVGNAFVDDPSFDWGVDDFSNKEGNELVICALHVGSFNDDDLDLWQFVGCSENVTCKVWLPVGPSPRPPYP